MELPEYRIIQRTMHGGRVWLIPQFRKCGLGEMDSFWRPLRLDGLPVQFNVTEPKDMHRGMEMALQSIDSHKNKITLYETVVWPEVAE